MFDVIHAARPLTDEMVNTLVAIPIDDLETYQEYDGFEGRGQIHICINGQDYLIVQSSIALAVREMIAASIEWRLTGEMGEE
jgi:hypothetical protein